MKMILNVKGKRPLNPIKNDVIIFDGKDWYMTTKEDVLKESLELLEECKSELSKIKTENAEFKKQIASQMLEMSKIIKTMVGE